MTLSALIRKRETGNLATAIPAIPAIHGRDKGGTVARIATIAVANPEKQQTALPAIVGPGDTADASRWWLIHYPDRDPVEVACSPPATHAEILAWHPDAVAAEPFTPTIRQPSTPMTAEEETAVRAWLALVEETDPATITEVLSQCQRDGEARDYFTGRFAVSTAKEQWGWPLINGEEPADDRRKCKQCTNLRGGICTIAEPGGMVSANRGYRPADILRRCAGFTITNAKKPQEVVQKGGE